MYELKKLLVILFSVFVLAACSGDVYEGQDAEEAILNLQKDFIKDLTDLQMVDVNENEVFAVFKAVISGEPEVFVAYVKQDGEKWRVQEAIAVGHETVDDLPPAKGEYIEGEFINRTSDSTEVEQVDGKYIFNLQNTERAVTVKFK